LPPGPPPPIPPFPPPPPAPIFRAEYDPATGWGLVADVNVTVALRDDGSLRLKHLSPVSEHAVHVTHTNNAVVLQNLMHQLTKGAPHIVEPREVPERIERKCPRSPDAGFTNAAKKSMPSNPDAPPEPDRGSHQPAAKRMPSTKMPRVCP